MMGSSKKLVLKKYLKDEKGTVLIELAIAIPILLLIFFGIVQMMLIYNAYMLTAYASYTGAREVALGGDSADVQRDARTVLGSINQRVTIPIMSSIFLQTSVKRGDDVSLCRVNYRMPVNIPMVQRAIDLVGSLLGFPRKQMGTIAKMAND